MRIFEWGCPSRDLCVVQYGRYVGFAFRKQSEHHAELRHGDRVIGRSQFVEGNSMPAAKAAAEDLLLDHVGPEVRSLVYRARAAGLSGCGRRHRRR